MVFLKRIREINVLGDSQIPHKKVWLSLKFMQRIITPCTALLSLISVLLLGYLFFAGYVPGYQTHQSIQAAALSLFLKTIYPLGLGVYIFGYLLNLIFFGNVSPATNKPAWPNILIYKPETDVEYLRAALLIVIILIQEFALYLLLTGLMIGIFGFLILGMFL